MPHKDLIKKMHNTEKASLLKKSNKYVFNVDNRANKKEIQKLLSTTHKVNVVSVNIVRIGKIKKAIITLKAGQSINEKV